VPTRTPGVNDIGMGYGFNSELLGVKLADQPKPFMPEIIDYNWSLFLRKQIVTENPHMNYDTPSALYRHNNGINLTYLDGSVTSRNGRDFVVDIKDGRNCADVVHGVDTAVGQPRCSIWAADGSFSLCLMVQHVKALARISSPTKRQVAPRDARDVGLGGSDAAPYSFLALTGGWRVERQA